MIARIWRGAVRSEDGDAYAAYIGETGLAGYATVPGNRGAWLLRRETGGLTEFMTFSLWESPDAIRAFAVTTSRRLSTTRKTTAISSNATSASCTTRSPAARGRTDARTQGQVVRTARPSTISANTDVSASIASSRSCARRAADAASSRAPPSPSSMA